MDMCVPSAGLFFTPELLGNWMPPSQFRFTTYLISGCTLQVLLFFAEMSPATGWYFYLHILFPFHAQWDGREASGHSSDICMERTHCILCKEQHAALSHAFPFVFLWETGRNLACWRELPESSYLELYSIIKINSKTDTQQKGNRTQQKTIGSILPGIKIVLNFSLI